MENIQVLADEAKVAIEAANEGAVLEQLRVDYLGKTQALRLETPVRRRPRCFQWKFAWDQTLHPPARLNELDSG